MSEKTHWKKLTNPDYIGAFSLEEGKDLVVTIKDVKRMSVTQMGGKQEECTVATLIGQKPFIINKTNAKTITQVVGSPYIEDWGGQSIILFASKTKFGKDNNVECLRVRPTAPRKPDLILDSEDYNKVKEAIKNGYTLAQIQTKFSVSVDVQKSLGL